MNDTRTKADRSYVALLHQLGTTGRRPLALAGFGAALIAWTFLAPIPEADAAEDVQGVAAVRTATTPSLPGASHGRVDFWITHFAGREEAFERQMRRRGRYEAMILRKLEERRLPRDLIYLAWIESGFLPTVESHAGAVGLWQFMPETARWLGLRVDAVVDERRDPVKSTDAALTFLSGLYRRYGSWHLAMAAYNGGPTRVSRIVRQHARGPWGHESLYWQVLEYLPTETAHYVPRLLAVRSLATERFREAPRFVPDAPYEYDVVWVSRPLTFTELSRLSGLSVEELRELNPHLVAERIPRGLEPHPLRVPVGTATRVAGTLVRPRPAFAQADD